VIQLLRLAFLFAFLIGLALLVHLRLKLEAAESIIANHVDPRIASVEWRLADAGTGTLLQILIAGSIVVLLIAYLRILQQAERRPLTSTEALAPLTNALRELKRQEALSRVEKQQAEVQMTGMRAVHTTVLEGIGSGVLTVDANDRIVTCNRAARDILGWSGGSADGRPLVELFKGNLPVQLTNTEGNEHSSRVEFEWIPTRGAPKTLGMSISAIHTPQGQLTAVLFSDLTEVKRLQRTADLRRHLAQLGEVSAGIAHEFRNNMGAMMGYARLIAHDVPPDSGAGEVVQAMMGELSQMEHLIRDLLEFSRRDTLDLAAVDAAGLIKGAAEVVAAGMSVPIRVTAPAGLPALRADETHLRQSLINLVRNGCEAAREGAPSRGEPPRVTVSITVDSTQRGTTHPRMLQISVTDNGPGIDPEVRRKIFLPFFTTKDEGTGMGLAHVHKTVTAHGGEVSVETATGGGTTFLLRLPTVYAEGPPSSISIAEAA